MRRLRNPVHLLAHVQSNKPWVRSDREILAVTILPQFTVQKRLNKKKKMALGKMSRKNALEDEGSNQRHNF